MALYQAGIGPGDEVIVPALTFAATVNPVLYVGATPVLVDVDPDTWTINTREIEKHINQHTKAIIPVHLYGNPCDMTEIMDIAARSDLIVIEDATESLGARYGEKYTGTLGHFGCFSFNGNKTMTTGGGGMVVGQSKDNIDHIRFLVNQAREEARGYYHPEMGFNLRMTNLAAALGLAQLRRLPHFLEKKRAFREAYEKDLSHRMQLQKIKPGRKSSNWLVSGKVENNIDDLLAELKKSTIQARRVFMPLSCFEYLGYEQVHQNAMEIYNHGICLPTSSLNHLNSIHKVIKTLNRFL